VVQELGPVGVLEVEVLELRPHVEPESHLRRAVELPLQDVARVAVECVAVRVVDVAEHPGDVLLRSPRDDLEGGGIRPSHHVGFLDPGEPFDGAAVEPHPLGERALQLLGRDGEGLQEPQDIGEPQADEPDPALLHRAQDVFGFLRERHRLRG
jgi:hypothetical protein